MTARVIPLHEPVIISQFWRNRSGEAIRIELREYKGIALVDVRVFQTNVEGKLAPTQKGFSCSVRCLPNLAKGFAKALARAIDIGLIDEF